MPWRGPSTSWRGPTNLKWPWVWSRIACASSKNVSGRFGYDRRSFVLRAKTSASAMGMSEDRLCFEQKRQRAFGADRKSCVLRAKTPAGGMGLIVCVDKSFVRIMGKRTVFGNWWGGPQKLATTAPIYKEMKAHTAKMQENESPQGQNVRKCTPTRPKCKEMKAHKAKLRLNMANPNVPQCHGPRPASANLQGANPNVPQCQMLRNMDHAREGASFQGASRNVPQEELLLNMDHAHPDGNLQGAKLNVPQEEMLLNMDPWGGPGSEQISLGLGCLPLTGNPVACYDVDIAWRQRPSFTWASTCVFFSRSRSSGRFGLWRRRYEPSARL